MPELTDEGVATLYKSLPNLTHVDFEKGHDLADAALSALVDSSQATLTYLSILGWREVSLDALNRLTRCTKLTHLNLGWCRQVTDFLLKDLLDACPDLAVIYVWGESSDRSS
jgi:DNA repair protein RAD7